MLMLTTRLLHLLWIDSFAVSEPRARSPQMLFLSLTDISSIGCFWVTPPLLPRSAP